ncbi:hypothetical protein AJ80_01959 [Polytolypa hystricis UAMH7299]|uniref:Protein kinase domain-containing protein n=1 Tax=Polytolypa hystricis (strain UAMH7299) TaxID=1447883 RepID=A0A2B7YTE1_POLH7|nr:hypothetical protein AJ80_01959 [Polytolypa hystricis UAMH7299]
MSVMDDTMIGRWLSDLPMDDPTRKSTSKPMLRRFIHHDKPIKYLGFLGSGAEAVVYRVEIEGNEYAIKIFRHWTYSGWEALEKRARHYAYPIAHEARAFARLDSVGKNGTWAVHARVQISDGNERPRSGSKRASGGAKEIGACDSLRHSVKGEYASPKSATRTLTSDADNSSEGFPSQIGGMTLGGTQGSSGWPSRRVTGSGAGLP